MTPLGILHVITRMVVGGAQENTLATVVGLRARGHDVILVTGPSGGPEGSLVPRARELGVVPVVIPELVREVSPRRDCLALARLYRLIRAGDFDVVHTHTSKAGVLGRIAARMAGVPAVVHTPHGHVFDGYFGRAATTAFSAIERACAGFTDAMIAISEPCRSDHLRLRIGRPERFVTIPSGIPAPGRRERRRARRLLGLTDGEVVVGCVGRLAPVKGQDVLLSAFARILREHPASRLVLVGDGAARPELETLASRLGAAHAVGFLGLRADADRLLPGFDLYAQPSLNEGMGRALAKAMAVGLPVVATNAPGPSELLAGGGGVLVPAGDESALAASLGRLIGDARLRRSLGRAARRRARSFWSEDDMVEAIEELYLKLVPPRSRRTRRAEERSGC
jgi:glycosyltransferase involved in cell wall biosynthesis